RRLRRPRLPTRFPYTTLFRSDGIKAAAALASIAALAHAAEDPAERNRVRDAIEVLLAKPEAHQLRVLEALTLVGLGLGQQHLDRSEEHTSELQSRENLVCRLL